MPTNSDSRASLASKRACFHCAKSKLRCIWPETDDGQIVQPEPVAKGLTPTASSTTACKRCGRQGLPCWVAEASRRGPRIGNGVVRSRVGKLEQKIDAVMSLLTSGDLIRQPSIDLGTSSLAFSISQNGISINTEPLPGSGQGVIDMSLPRRLILGGATRQEDVAPPGLTSPQLSICIGYTIDSDEAQLILEDYRANFFPSFPFVKIPTNISAVDLFQTQPFLFRTIIQVVAPISHSRTGGDSSNKSTRTRVAFHRWFRKTLVERMVGDQQKSLEMLQAILVFASWGDYYLSGDFRGSEIIQLALSLVSDLGLDIPPLGDQRQEEHTLAERRAVLGCFFLTSSLSPILRQPCMLSWTNHLSQCCDQLLISHATQDAESDPSDLYLGNLVRMQFLAKHWSSVLSSHSDTTPANYPNTTSSPIFREPTYLSISLAQSEINALTNTLPDTITHNALLWTLHHHTTHARLTSHAISAPATPPSQPPYPSPSQTDLQARNHRLQVLCDCMQSCINIIETYLTIPSSEINTCPLTTTSCLAFALITLRRLLLPGKSHFWRGNGEIDDWNPAVARESVDLPGLLGRLCGHFEEAYYVFLGSRGWDGSLVGEGDGWLDDGEGARDGIGILGYWRKLRKLRGWYVREVGRLDGGMVPGLGMGDSEDFGGLGEF